jgi:HlyD family secretion protein
MSKASLARAEDDLAKTTIKAPTDGTVTKLKIQAGERVVGTAMMAGTEIMTIAQLDAMEARVDLGEVDVVLIALGQKARLEVDSFRDRTFNGVVTEIANAAKTSGLNTQQEATKFEVKIRIYEKEGFRPGMSVTAEVETRYRSNVLTIPIQSVTMRLPKEAEEAKKQLEKKKDAEKEKDTDAPDQNSPKKAKTGAKAEEVVFEIRNGVAHRLKVKRGISDNDYVEILEGVAAGQEIVSGSYKAINRELEEGKRVVIENKKTPL